MSEKRKYCCDMHKKVVLSIANIRDEIECGVPDSAMAEFHDFAYRSTSNLPVAAALSFRFCPWCGTPRDENDRNRRIVETTIRTA
ncbi:MAG: hypothetical protein AB7L09_01300 [Nitrospira sp.]